MKIPRFFFDGERCGNQFDMTVLSSSPGLHSHNSFLLKNVWEIMLYYIHKHCVKGLVSENTRGQIQF